jgi:glycerol uptake facilitator-like aquaporin
MWALMIYWLVTTLLSAMRVATAAMVAGAIATAVEFLKLYRSPWMDAFRGTLAGALLLGRYFSWKDIIAYWIAIVLGAFLDWRIWRRSVIKT